MVEREAPGDFEYLRDDPVADPETQADFGDLWDDPDDGVWGNQPEPDDDARFDAFNAKTWHFKPAPKPWYRTAPAMSALIAATIAAVAIVVSVVLLTFRGPTPADDESTTVAPTAPSAAATPSRANPPPPSPPPPPPPPPSPPPPPPPPPPAAEAPADRAPVYRPQQPRQTRKPEFGVTRTPETRSPISVAPEPRGPRN